MQFPRIAATAIALALGALPAMAETLKVGSTPTGVPFTYLDVKSGEITGMMVDVVKAIAAKEDFEADVQSTDWVSLLPALQAGRIDMISAAMSITDERKKVVDFSDPIFPYGEGLIVPKTDDTQYSEDLHETKGKTIGVQQGTSYQAKLAQMGDIGEVKTYENLADLLKDVELGRIDMAFGDKPIIAYQMGQGKFADLKMAEGYTSQFVLPLGIAVSKDHPEILAKVNAGLAKIKADGELDELIKKWNLN
ncbi:ABC transporter substrate-binding protein [Thioclava sp. GXIMD2076]|uniref:ABC transporter substrate-binding protein n=1 Tax=Thioclava kandeliae TaxID=3070818 RepID=A0ABV1SHT5_9RHOB